MKMTPGIIEPVQIVRTAQKGAYVGKYEVTQGEYLNIMGTNPSYFAGLLNNPVENITWFNAIDYCNALSIKEGLIERKMFLELK